MIPEQLLMPRYEVIAPYPDMPFKVGDILEMIDLGASVNPFYLKGCFGQANTPHLYNPEKYPVIFRKLEWWEKRDVKDLPGYVKRLDCIYKVDNYNLSRETMLLDTGFVTFISGYSPATEQEYLNSKK